MQKMTKFDDFTKENIKKHNPNWLQLPDHPCRMLIIAGSGSGKINSLFNLMIHLSEFGKFYLLSIHMKQNINC